MNPATKALLLLGLNAVGETCSDIRAVVYQPDLASGGLEKKPYDAEAAAKIREERRARKIENFNRRNKLA